MAWLRYLIYFMSVTLLTWLLTRMEIWSPGSLRLHVIQPGDALGTSEFSPIEIIQPLILAICGLLMLWVTRTYPPQRPLAMVFGGLAVIFIIRECDYFLDRYFVDNLWQVLVVISSAIVIAYGYRNSRRLRIALIRIWPSPGLTLLFSGALVLFVFSLLIGHEPLWQSILGPDYQRVFKLALEEFIELMGYLLWLIGSFEYAWQARSMATAEPQHVVQRRREKRRSGSGYN
jgi:hypothetical protein